MSRCKLRTPWPIHFKLRIVIGIIVLQSVYFLVKFRFFIPELWDLNYYSVLFQHKYCINVPIHVYGAAVGEI